MRRAALNKSKRRRRDSPTPGANANTTTNASANANSNANTTTNTTQQIADSSLNVVESRSRNEHLQTAHHHHHQHHQLVDSATVIDAVSTSTSPSASATNATPLAPLTTDSTNSVLAGHSYQDNYDQFTPSTHRYTHTHDSESESESESYDSGLEAESESDSDLDQDEEDGIGIDSEAPVRVLPSDEFWVPTTNLDLDLDYIPFYHDVDHDLEMSDSEGGAPLDEDIYDELQTQTYQQSTQSEDNDGPAPTMGSVNYLSQPLLQISAIVDTDLIMDAAPPPAPWGVITDADSIPSSPQTPTPMPLEPLGPSFIENPNPNMFGSINLGLFDFLTHWAYQARFSSNSSVPRADAPCPEDIRRQADTQVHDVRYDDLYGDCFDMQGLNWESMNTTRQHARRERCKTFRNYVNKEGSDKWSPHMADVDIPSSKSFMRFKRFLVRQDVHLAHFQLRSVLACPAISQVYYPGGKGINCINPISGKTELKLNNSHIHGLGGLISTLDVNYGVMFAGTFNGEYYLKRLDSEDKKDYSEGHITSSMGGITNHVQIYQPRQSSAPVAAISSNDEGFRVLDLTTEQFLTQSRYLFPLNCSRISPDGRLRVMVGDDFKVLITNADSGEIQQELSGHRDYGFSCDWSDDGWTVATGFQDKGIKIWDARRWCDSRGVSTPLCTIRSEMSGVRNLRFSPVGSGERVLVAAEEADYVNIIDAQTFYNKQTVDIFGEIGGVAFTNDGQDLNVLVSDRDRGGLLQLERSGLGPEPYFHNSWRRYHDSGSDSWRYRSDEYSHLGEPSHRNPISTDALAIF
ncbi:WD40-repeat-containing domain protein [Fusarium avenaceum]|nr:WD40-repeat-containing domain protein [Fusarium avenaceum]